MRLGRGKRRHNEDKDPRGLTFREVGEYRATGEY
jgi:hypothetical protein